MEYSHQNNKQIQDKTTGNGDCEDQKKVANKHNYYAE